MYAKEYFMEVIDRAFRVLGGDMGELQNAMDIAVWFKEGYIDASCRDELIRYNIEVARRNENEKN